MWWPRKPQKIKLFTDPEWKDIYFPLSPILILSRLGILKSVSVLSYAFGVITANICQRSTTARDETEKDVFLNISLYIYIFRVKIYLLRTASYYNLSGFHAKNETNASITLVEQARFSQLILEFTILDTLMVLTEKLKSDVAGKYQ